MPVISDQDEDAMTGSTIWWRVRQLMEQTRDGLHSINVSGILQLAGRPTDGALLHCRYAALHVLIRRITGRANPRWRLQVSPE
jgi:hypothetical protein